MTKLRRLGYAVGGALAVMVAGVGVESNYRTHTIYFKGRAFLRQVILPPHEWTLFAVCLSAMGFYLLASAARGERLFSRRWVMSAVAAVVLAWLLVGSLAALRYFQPVDSFPGAVVTYD